MIKEGAIYSPQLTDTIVMISPDQFGFNPETAVDNPYQHQPIEALEARKKVLIEFDSTVQTLEKNDIQVLVLPSRKDIITQDAIFPNNWFSHHGQGGNSGTIVLYPMRAENRRAERQIDNLRGLLTTIDIIDPAILDLTAEEIYSRPLEGTGSLVLDRVHKVAFAMESQRTNGETFQLWCQKMGYDGVFFHAQDKTSKPVYHTNIVMSIGEKFAVVCFEAMNKEGDKSYVRQTLLRLGKDIIDISAEQMNTFFCGNILQMRSRKNESKVILSERALEGFQKFGQAKRLERYGQLVPVNIPTIEEVGGGSARCMLAEIFVH